MISYKFKVFFVQIDKKGVDILGKLGILCYTCKKPPKLIASKCKQTPCKKLGGKNSERWYFLFFDKPGEVRVKLQKSTYFY